MVSSRVAVAVAAGELPPVMSGFYFPRVVRGRVLLDQVWTRLVHIWGDPTRSQVLSDAEVEARKQLWQVHEWLKANVPGFERSFISHTSTQVWPREGRRLRGLATLDEHMVRTNARSDQGVAKGACFIEVRDPKPQSTGASPGLGVAGRGGPSAACRRAPLRGGLQSAEEAGIGPQYFPGRPGLGLAQESKAHSWPVRPTPEARLPAGASPKKQTDGGRSLPECPR